MVKGVADLITGLMVIFPPWVVAGLGVFTVVTLGPRWIESMRDKQIRGLIRRMVRADNEERQRLTEAVKRIAGTSPARRAATVHHAIHYDQRPLRDAMLGALDASGEAPDEVKRLRAKIEKPPTRFRDPVEAVVRIERLLDDGLVVAAQEQLEAALAAFPDDPEIVALGQRVPSGE